MPATDCGRAIRRRDAWPVSPPAPPHPDPGHPAPAATAAGKTARAIATTDGHSARDGYDLVFVRLAPTAARGKDPSLLRVGTGRQENQ